ncbi:unnamed protein product [Protopolystoma xenopodis]|uniref:Uncharacterized protein n=1 Tax=Protopolystoma xenopodis TaxID=117903 RepID=A0A448X4B6_9PLAT|nr:unnamed protein product [Protopolystoma xenopodis]
MEQPKFGPSDPHGRRSVCTSQLTRPPVLSPPPPVRVRARLGHRRGEQSLSVHRRRRQVTASRRPRRRRTRGRIWRGPALLDQQAATDGQTAFPPPLGTHLRRPVSSTACIFMRLPSSQQVGRRQPTVRGRFSSLGSTNKA